MDRPSPEIVTCPSCDARNFAIDDTCAECGQPLLIVILPRPKVRRVRIGSVMIVVAVVAVCLAPARIAPGASILLALFLVPATIRGLLVLEGRRLDGRRSSGDETAQVFVASFFICAAIICSAGFAFCVTCFPIGMATFNLHPRASGTALPGVFLAFASGGVAALAVLYYVGKKLWPDRD